MVHSSNLGYWTYSFLPISLPPSQVTSLLPLPHLQFPSPVGRGSLLTSHMVRIFYFRFPFFLRPHFTKLLCSPSPISHPSHLVMCSLLPYYIGKDVNHTTFLWSKSHKSTHLCFAHPSYTCSTPNFSLDFNIVVLVAVLRIAVIFLPVLPRITYLHPPRIPPLLPKTVFGAPCKYISSNTASNLRVFVLCDTYLVNISYCFGGLVSNGICRMLHFPGQYFLLLRRFSPR